MMPNISRDSLPTSWMQGLAIHFGDRKRVEPWRIWTGLGRGRERR
uniref:Uncharacterized protein n=1 Tax=Arundo donax TaxID=35708 RepID=A0A0A9AA65_ARUDO